MQKRNMHVKSVCRENSTDALLLDDNHDLSPAIKNPAPLSLTHNKLYPHLSNLCSTGDHSHGTNLTSAKFQRKHIPIECGPKSYHHECCESKCGAQACTNVVEICDTKDSIEHVKVLIRPLGKFAKLRRRGQPIQQCQKQEYHKSQKLQHSKRNPAGRPEQKY